MTKAGEETGDHLDKILSLRGVSVEFATKTLFGGANEPAITAIRNVSLDVEHGESLAIVGESGCGKSTLGRVMLGLIQVSAGSVHYRGHDIAGLSRVERQHARRKLQMVFQNPYGALDPRFRVSTSVREPLDVGRIGSRRERQQKALRALELVGIDERQARARPQQLSGGQQQRVGIARAIVTSPDILVCDEVTSALDVSVKIQIVDLLASLRDELQVTYVFISHDLGVVQQVATRVAVMYLGKIVEVIKAQSIYKDARHPYTRALLEAVPIPDPAIERNRHRVVLSGEVPSLSKPPSGCAFRSRCPIAQVVCAEQPPPLTARSTGHLVACHFA